MLNSDAKLHKPHNVPTTIFKYIWASPASAVGVCAALLAGVVGAKVRRVSGVLEVSLAPRGGVLCKAVACMPFAAITFGHVVIACSAQEQAAHRTHERVHVAQYERWGPFFLLAYPLESLYQCLLGAGPIWTTGLRQLPAWHVAKRISGRWRWCAACSEVSVAII